MVAPVVLHDPMVVVAMMMMLGERGGRRTPTNQGGDGKGRRDLPYSH
jgi:hypothetical protein